MVRIDATDEAVFVADGFQPASNGGYNLGASAKRFNQVHINHLCFKETSSTPGDGQGDAIFLGTTNVAAGRVYYWDGTDWQNSDADAASSATGLLAVAMGTGNANTVGMLLRGFVTLSSTTGGSNADVLYLGTAANRLSSTAPSGTGDIVRVCGYLFDSSDDVIWFAPDGTWVEIA
jgi:hypothetical protein